MCSSVFLNMHTPLKLCLNLITKLGCQEAATLRNKVRRGEGKSMCPDTSQDSQTSCHTPGRNVHLRALPVALAIQLHRDIVPFCPDQSFLILKNFHLTIHMQCTRCRAMRDTEYWGTPLQRTQKLGVGIVLQPKMTMVVGPLICHWGGISIPWGKR